MLFGPNQLKCNNDNIYVIIETCQFTKQYKIIGATHSLVVAQTYVRPNITIQGPIPLMDTTAKYTVFDNPKFFDFTPKPPMFDTNEFAKPNFNTPNPFINEPPKFGNFGQNPFNNEPPTFGNFGTNPFNNTQQPEFNFNIPTTQQFNGFNTQSQPKPRRRQNYNLNNNFGDDNMDIC